MLNCLASLVMSTSVVKALPGKLDVKRPSPSILYKYFSEGEKKAMFHLETQQGTAAAEGRYIHFQMLSHFKEATLRHPWSTHNQ